MAEFTEAALEAVREAVREAIPWFTGLATALVVWWQFKPPPTSQFARLQRFVAADYYDSSRFPGGVEEKYGKARLWV